MPKLVAFYYVHNLNILKVKSVNNFLKGGNTSFQKKWFSWNRFEKQIKLQTYYRIPTDSIMNGLHICKIFVKCHVCKNWNSEILSNFQKNSKVNENTITTNCVVDLQFSCCNNMTDNYYFLLRNTFSKMPAAIFFPFAHVLFWSAVVCAAMTELVSSATCRTIVITAVHVLFWSAVVCAVMTELVSSAIGPLLSQLRMCCFDQLLCVQSWRSWSAVL